MPDRVTRLIKASKSSQKPARDTSSMLGGTSSPSGSSLNVTKPEVQVGAKLAGAQSELQACEAHLAEKERELDVMRLAAVRSGLSTRCKALVECGWAWGEMGKEGLRALEALEAGPHAHTNGTSPALFDDHGCAARSVHAGVRPSRSVQPALSRLDRRSLT